MKTKFCIFLLGMLLTVVAHATHNRAGEIAFRHLGGLQYEVTIITYTEISPSGNQADRQFLPVDWGDNSGRDSIERVQRVQISIYIQKNVYIKTHLYSGPGRYMISVEDPNRNANVQNIPNSVNVVFYIESELIIDPFAGHNNSVRLLNPPIDFACVGNVFVHNPSAYDPDGDSLSFSLVASKGFNGVVIPGYTFPAASNGISINNKTGQLIWDSPILVGEFNVAILVEEYKNGIRVGSVLRDMQITVRPPCEHNPPVIQNLTSFCIEAGDSLIFEITASDLSDGNTLKDGNEVTLEATGSVFEIDNPAFFNQLSKGVEVRGGFYWQTSCDEVRNTPYSVVFRAVDNGDPNLSSFLTTTMDVVAPAPRNFQAEAQKNRALLSWNVSECSNAAGYKIYRKLGKSDFNPGLCETGIPSSAGYTLIHRDTSINSTSFIDDDDGKGLIIGLEYCYRIYAYFEDGAESYATQEICIQLKKELPVITNVSVEETDTNDGRMYVAWSKPTEHDTIVYPGPYKYDLRRRIWNEDFQTIASLPSINDTIYYDTLINTRDNEFTYIVDMYDLSSGETFMGSSVSASSVYLNSLQEDNALILQWSEEVPWLNRSYILYRQNESSGEFEELAKITDKQAFIDTGLTNNKTYCYLLETRGEYLVSGLISPIINFSQIHCNFPVDTVAPCPPVLTLNVPNCIEDFIPEKGTTEIQSPCGAQNERFETELSWTNPNTACLNVDDVIEYNLFFSPTPDQPFKLLTTLKGAKQTTYTNTSSTGSIAGCYYITAVDSFGNVSEINDTLCIDNCPYYVLPNVFTPGNRDGINDIFRPFPFCFIDGVDILIFNRWGQTVFETSDPEINWDGINQESGELAADGVYFYVCTVREIRLEGIVEKKIKGTVQLLNGGIKAY